MWPSGGGPLANQLNAVCPSGARTLEEDPAEGAACAVSDTGPASNSIRTLTTSKKKKFDSTTWQVNFRHFTKLSDNFFFFLCDTPCP